MLEEDITQLNEAEQSQFIEQWKEKDRDRGFHLQKDVLMRIALIQTGESQYTCIWTFHHIMMDGWCLSIVLKEFLHIYASYVNASPITLEPVQPYGKYIKWLMEQDKEQAVSYWDHYLSGHEQQTVLPKQKKQREKAGRNTLHFHSLRKKAAGFQSLLLEKK